jgi:UDP-N-acetylglucosamine acyltransferase
MTINVHPTAIVEQGAILHEGVSIGPFCHVGPRVELGAGTRLIAHASVLGSTSIGPNCVLYPQSTLGGAPQVIGFKETPESRLEIGESCEFREHTSVHSGVPKSGGLTRIGNNCYMMAGSHLAHDGHLGNNVVMANGVQLAGHVVVADNVWFGGVAAVHQFTRIGRNAFIGGGAILVEDVIPFGSVIGNHARLAGLNIVGLKRRGFSKANLHEIRSAYKAVFEGEDLFKDRIERAASTFAAQPLAMELIDFIREGGNRPICKPE